MSVGAVNKQTGDRIPTAGMPAIDDELSLSSTNPVQNAIITNTLALKQDKTDNSLQTTDKTVVGAVNELKSGLTNVADDVKLNTNDLTTPSRTKNLLPMTLNGIKSANTAGTWSGNTYTLNGVTFTVQTDSDGNVTGININGTTTGGTTFDIANNVSIPLNGTYKFMGNSNFSSGVAANTFVFGNISEISTYNNAKTETISDNFTHAHIYLWSGRTFNNVIVYPMFMLASESSDDFAPYIPSVESRIEAVESGKATNSRTRNNITARLLNLITAVSEQNLEKYGYKIGDYFVGASGYTYILADMDTYYGGYNINAIVNTHHISLVVKTGASSKWAETNDTSGGYKTSTLHSFLSSTVLDNIKSDMIALFGGSTGLEHLVSHKLLWTTATSGAWAWSDNAEYISALSEPQVYGTNVWVIDGYQTGEAWKWLEVFHKFNFCEILGNIWWWLRSICSASYACDAGNSGDASHYGASNSGGAVGLIIFH